MRCKREIIPSSKWSWLHLVIGVLFVFFSRNEWHFAAAPWIGLPFFLRFARTGRKRFGLSIGFLVWVLIFMVTGLRAIPFGAIAIPITLVETIVTFLPIVADRIMAPRLEGVANTLVLPLSTVTVEIVTTLYSPGLPWAYLQAENLTLIQVASLTGFSGVTFLLMWSASTINFAWENGFVYERVKKPAFAFLLSFGLVLLYGGIRTSIFLPDTERTMVAGITNPKSPAERLVPLWEHNLAATKKQSEEDQQFFLSKTRTADSAGARLVVWQEWGVYLTKDLEPRFIARASALADELDIFLVMGLAGVDPSSDNPVVNNRLVWIGPDGKKMLEYHKNRPLPGMEHFPAGDQTVPVLRTDIGNLAGVICHDMDHGSLVRKAGSAGAGLLLAASQDWREMTLAHAKVAALRAVENGFALFKVTGTGNSIAFDQQGRTIATADWFASKQHLLLAEIPVSRIAAPYTVIGDLFAWIAALVFLTLVFITFRRGWKQP